MDNKDSVYLSLPRVVLTDGVLLLYLAAILPTIPALFWFDDPNNQLLLWILPLVLLSIYITTWRYDRVCRAFMFGREVKGKVLGVARLTVIPILGIEYSFEVDGKKMRHTALHHDSGRARKLNAGETVTIIYDFDHPSHSCIKDVYLSSCP